MWHFLQGKKPHSSISNNFACTVKVFGKYSGPALTYMQQVFFHRNLKSDLELLKLDDSLSSELRFTGVPSWHSVVYFLLPCNLLDNKNA